MSEKATSENKSTGWLAPSLWLAGSRRVVARQWQRRGGAPALAVVARILASPASWPWAWRRGATSMRSKTFANADGKPFCHRSATAEAAALLKGPRLGRTGRP